MENLAFLHAHAAYEDPSSAPILCPFQTIGWKANAAILSTGLGIIAGLIVLGHPVAIQALQYGNQGIAVSNVQRQLYRLGYNVGAIDGDFGINTERAVKQFQYDQRLAMDGVVGPDTAARLGLPVSDYSAFNVSTIQVATNGSDLNVREGPSMGYRVTASLPNGTFVQVVGSSNGWYEIVGGGWISGDWTTSGGIGGGSGAPIAPAVPGRVVISTGGWALNIRSAPGTDHDILGWYNNGDEAPVYEYWAGWYRTDKGWIAGNLVTKIQ